MTRSFFRRSFDNGILIIAKQRISLLALSCLAVLLIGIAPHADAGPPKPDHPVTGLIATKYKQLGGSAGPLGHPTSNEMDSKEGKGRYQTFEHGVIGVTPSTGQNSVQALYAKNLEMVFEWGDTSPFNYDFFIVRWDLNGKNIGQQDIKGGSRTSGRWVTHPAAAGRYRLVVEGADGRVGGSKSKQGWSNALYLDFTPPPPIPTKYAQLGGSTGPLGRATSKELDSKEGKGRYQTFEHGVIGWTPSTGPNSVQALYVKNQELVFEWGDTSPYNYDFFIVRWDVNGKNVGQQDIKGGPRTSGRWVTRPKTAGRYRVIVEGADRHLGGTQARQGWSNSLYIDFVPRKPWAVILCKFSDQPSYQPHPVSFYKDSFTEVGAGKGLEFDYFRQVSYGTLDMTGSKVFGWFNMSKHKTQDLASLKFPGDRGKLHDWGIEVAKANGIDLSPFYGVIVVFNSQTDSGAAGAHGVVLGYAKADWSPTFNFHEIGHGFDLNHSWFARPDIEYGDQWDIMSAMSVWTFNNKLGQASGPGMNACNLNRLGAIPPSRIWSTNKPGSATITLAALNRPEANGYLMASISPAAGSSLKTVYVVEFRQKKGWDAGIPESTVLVHEVRSNGLCYLLSRTERADRSSIEVLAGQDFKIPERNLTIRVKSFDAAASTASVEIALGK